ncbi:hypothetical protein ACQV5M_19915, partial [Leptospira sp. SA-E8]
AANLNYPEQIAEVQRVLAEIGAEQIPQILVFNKLDALSGDEGPSRRPPILQDRYDLDGFETPRVFVSARSGEGLAELRSLLSERVMTLARQEQEARQERALREEQAAQPV